MQNRKFQSVSIDECQSPDVTVGQGFITWVVVNYLYLAMSIRKYGYCYTTTPPAKKPVSFSDTLCQISYKYSIVLAKPSPIDEKGFPEIGLGEAS